MEKNDIPEMKIDRKYASDKNSMPAVDPTEQQKQMEKTKKEIDKVKDYIIKKYKNTKALGILPAQAIKFFIDEEEVPKETDKHIHLVMIVSDEEEKEIPKITKDIVEYIEKAKTEQKIWLQIRTTSEIWEMALDQKFELSSAFAMCYPLHDTGILAGMRVSEIHKSLVLQKFEKYVVSYVIAGSLVRGEATATSDVDVFIIINDTDVKRMSRLELKDRLRGIIFNYIGEAAAMAGVDPSKLNAQVYLLTDFWESVKDANPIMFTFIRDGIPLYDRGTFMPWKALLKMGKLKPSPEAIDMFMKAGEGVITRNKRIMMSELFVNLFWGVTTPAQALLMLNGCPPPNAKKELVPGLKKEFLETKMIEKKYIDFIEKIVSMWRAYEHEELKEITGKEMDELSTQTEDCLKRFQELREQIEKKSAEKTIDDVYNEVMKLLKHILGNYPIEKLVKEFEKQLVKTGKFTDKHLEVLERIIKAKAEIKKTKEGHLAKIDKARRDAYTLINALVEYTQRIEIADIEKKKMVLKYDKDKIAEMLVCEKCAFLFVEGKITKLTDKSEESNNEEVTKCLQESKGKKINADMKYFALVEKILGKYEIVLE